MAGLIAPCTLCEGEITQDEVDRYLAAKRRRNWLSNSTQPKICAACTWKKVIALAESTPEPGKEP